MYGVESAFEDLVSGMTPEVRETLNREISNLEYEISEAECEEEHCYESHVDSTGAQTVISEKLQKIRLGVYDEERHGNLRETLEELEGLL